jgi:hypothetical protein
VARKHDIQNDSVEVVIKDDLQSLVSVMNHVHREATLS